MWPQPGALGSAELFVDGSISHNMKDRILQSTGEQILDVPVPQITEKLEDAPKISSKDQIMHWGAVSRCSRAADGGTVGGCAEDRFSRQNRAADFRAAR